MTASGTVIATIAADRALSVSGNHPSRASTSTDNSVTYRLASKYLVTSSNYTPIPGTGVTISAQLADAAGSPVPTSGVVVTWSMTGTGGSFSAATSTTNASGIATVTFTVGTTTGTVYTVIATSAGSVTGTSPNITATAPAAVISLVRSTSMVRYSENVGFTIQFGAGGGNRTFFLEHTSVGSTWHTIATLATNAAGAAAFSYRPYVTGYYRARFAGATDLSAATSNVVLVGVRQIVNLLPHHAGTLTIARGTSITFRSSVRPLRPDLVPSTITFRFYQSVGGTWLLRYTRNVAVDSAAVARTTFRFGAAGLWYVRSFAPRTPYASISVLTQREVFLVR